MVAHLLEGHGEGDHGHAQHPHGVLHVLGHGLPLHALHGAHLPHTPSATSQEQAGGEDA